MEQQLLQSVGGHQLGVPVRVRVRVRGRVRVRVSWRPPAGRTWTSWAYASWAYPNVTLTLT